MDTTILRAVMPDVPAIRDRQIGVQLVDSGKLSVQDAERVLKFQKENRLRFGEAAVRLGLVTEADIQRVLSKQFDYPVVARGESDLSGELIAAYDPYAKQVESFRALRSQLLLRWFAPDPARKLLAVVSCGRHEGRSYVAANLAVVFSQLGERTLLIDADLRQPRQHHLFGLRNNHGLSTLLSERVSDAIQPVPALVDLSVVTAGPTPPNPQELVSRSIFSDFLQKMSEEFAVIIVDTPPAGTYADAHAIVGRTGGALMVARKDHAKLSEVRAAVSNIRSANAEVVGIMLNHF